MAHSILEDVPEQTFTESTIRRMYSLIDRAKTDAEFQKLIYGLVNGAMRGQWKDYKRELSVVFNWFKKNVDYRRDPYGVELLQDVWATLDRQRGDCDDASVFMAAAAEVLGSPARIVTVSTRPSKEPNHVYAEAFISGRWNGLDATIRESYVGWAPPQVTARRIWTRKELGLSGGDDMDGIEGLGMNENEADDFGTMYPVSRMLAPGVPDDISKTFAKGRPGTTDLSRRRIWRAPVANNSEWTSNPRPGGGVYGPALPIGARPTPKDLWYLVDRKFVPKVLNPDSAWWGKVPTSREQIGRMFPGSDGTMDNYLRDIASVPASAIAEVAKSVRAKLASGRVLKKDVPEVIENALEGYALGLTGKLMQSRPPSFSQRYIPHLPLRYFVQAPVGPDPIKVNTSSRGARMKGLGNLGDVITDLTKSISTAVATGVIPGDPSSVNQAISAAVDAATGTTTPAPKVSTVAKTAIPMGMLALLGGAAYLMSRGGGYRRNPSRRRGGRRSGRGGFDMKTALLWGGGATAAYFLLLKPGGFLTPAPRPVTTGPIPGMNATQQAALAAGIKAAPSIFDSISKLFGGSPSTPAAMPSSSEMITSYEQLFPEAQAPAPSEFITSYS